MVRDYEPDPPRPDDDDPIASVRQRPGMYFGSADAFAKHEILLEFVSNAVDQYLQGKATLVRVQVEGDRFTVEDDGAGLARAKARKHLAEPHYTPTADRHAPHIHLGGSGAGFCPANAACSEFLIQSFDCEGGWRLLYEKGRLVKEEECAPVSGTKVTGHIDVDIFAKQPLPLWKARRVLFDAVHLFPGLKVQLNEEVFHAPGGLQDLARFEAMRHELRGWVDNSRKSFGHVHDGEALMFTIACYGAVERSEETILASWVNGLMTPGHGSHVDGALAALRFVGWSPAALMLSVVMKEPEYAGPTRDKLRVDKVRSLVRDAVIAAYEANESGSLENSAPDA